MIVRFSRNVNDMLRNYRSSLLYYPITRMRAIQKTSDMLAALKKVGSNPEAYPVCNYKDLGQMKDAAGNNLLQNLRLFKYKDKSKFQWMFSFYIDYENETVIFKMMKASNMVKEQKTNDNLDSIIRKVIKEEVEKSNGWRPSYYGPSFEKKSKKYKDALHKSYNRWDKYQDKPDMDKFEKFTWDIFNAYQKHGMPTNRPYY